MKVVEATDLHNLYLPPKGSHKGQNGRLLIIGGSHLFHAASLWALKVASRIVDLVHYCSVEENNELVKKLKQEFRDGIVVPRKEVESYIEEDDAILIGPGMVRSEVVQSHIKYIKDSKNIADIDQITDEGWQTSLLTNYLLSKYSYKQWVIDAGALQMLDINLIPSNAVLTPHQKEFALLWERHLELTGTKFDREIELADKVGIFAKHHSCIVLVKGEIDIACNGVEARGRICTPGECLEIRGGNAGMTKGGTGDVLAGLIAALTCKNDPFLATSAGAFINKQAGDSLYKKVGPFFNASDLADEIPQVMKNLFVN